MLADAESVLDIAERWLEAGRRVVWATVVGTWSSSPRPLGSQMIIADDGRFAGSVSGGCVESAVIQAAPGVLEARASKRLEYGVTTEQAWEVGLPCGGKIELFLAEVSHSLLEPLRSARAARRGITWLTDLERGTQQVWTQQAGAESLMPRQGLLADAVARAVEQDRSQLIELEGRRIFAHVLAAPLRLVVVGAVHLTQALGDLARLNGFEVIVIDPRTAFGTPERFPGATLVHAWPDIALSALRPDSRTAVVVLSHDAKLDEPALVTALRSPCFYIGALGSQRTQQARRRRLADEGFGEGELARIHGPVGLDIGALTTSEIAVAIMAEIIQARRKPRHGVHVVPRAET